MRTLSPNRQGENTVRCIAIEICKTDKEKQMENKQDVNKSDFTEKKPGVPSHTGRHRDTDSGELAAHLRKNVTSPSNQLDENPVSSSGDTPAGTNVEAERKGGAPDERKRTGAKEQRP
jgi:hypothetical protein